MFVALHLIVQVLINGGFFVCFVGVLFVITLLTFHAVSAPLFPSQHRIPDDFVSYCFQPSYSIFQS